VESGGLKGPGTAPAAAVRRPRFGASILAARETAAPPGCWGAMEAVPEDSPAPRAGIRAALFDVDGTLVDSNDLHAAAWAEAFHRFGFDIPFDAIRFQIGKGGDNLIPALLPDLGPACREAIEEYRSELFRRDYLPRVRPFPGVRPLFERLHGDGVTIVLASSSHRDEIDHVLDLLGCRDLVAATTSKDDVARSKPCPDIFEAALARIAPIGPESAAVVGDSPWDMKAAAKLGLVSIGFRCGGFPDEALIEAGACALYDGPEDLLRRYGESIFARGGGDGPRLAQGDASD
jgi:HAD superfamily hydrolase (TIGR01509 family)